MLSLRTGSLRPLFAGLLRPAATNIATRITATQINNDSKLFAASQRKQFFLSQCGSTALSHSQYMQHTMDRYKQVRAFASTVKLNDVNDVTPGDARRLGHPQQDPTNVQDFSTTREQENRRMFEEAITDGHSGKYASLGGAEHVSAMHRRYRIMGGLSIVVFVSLLHPLISWNAVRTYRAYKVRGEDGNLENHGGEWLRASYDRGSENWKPMSQIHDEVAARYKSASKFRVLKYIKPGSDNDMARRKTGEYPQHGKPSKPNPCIGKLS